MLPLTLTLCGPSACLPAGLPGLACPASLPPPGAPNLATACRIAACSAPAINEVLAAKYTIYVFRNGTTEAPAHLFPVTIPTTGAGPWTVDIPLPSRWWQLKVGAVNDNGAATDSPASADFFVGA